MGILLYYDVYFTVANDYGPLYQPSQCVINLENKGIVFKAHLVCMA